MPRTSASQPRMNQAAKPSVTLGKRDRPITVDRAKGKTRLAQAVRGLTSRASVADLTRFAADSAKRNAELEARAAGADEKTLKRMISKARAAAIKSAAEKAGVSTTTARRWVNGSQKPSARGSEGRERLVRSLGGARAIQAAQIRATTKVNLGTVKIESYGTGPNTRYIGELTVSPEAMSAVATKLEDGDFDGAMEDLNRVLMTAYGKGDDLSDVIKIVDIENAITWG